MKMVEYFLMSWFTMGALIACSGLLWLYRTSTEMLQEVEVKTKADPVAPPVDSMVPAEK